GLQIAEGLIRLSILVQRTVFYVDIPDYVGPGDTLTAKRATAYEHGFYPQFGPDFLVEVFQRRMFVGPLDYSARTEYKFTVPGTDPEEKLYQDVTVNSFSDTHFILRMKQYIGNLPINRDFTKSCFELTEAITQDVVLDEVTLPIIHFDFLSTPKTDLQVAGDPLGVVSWGLTIEDYCGGPVEEPPGEDLPTPTPPDATDLDVQSKHIYLQAAGSTGADGTAPGVHLRWIFKNRLGDRHLPKGSFITQNPGPSGPAPAGEAPRYPDVFNKVDDYVRVFRIPYTPQATRIALNIPPQTVLTVQRIWLYSADNRIYRLKFLDSPLYDAALAEHDPATAPQDFLEAYGAGRLEFESPDALFFSAKLEAAERSPEAQVRLEAMAVEGAGVTVLRNVAARQVYQGNQVGAIQQLGENLISLRFEASEVDLTAIEVETYTDHLAAAITGSQATYLGQFALTQDQGEAFQRLEPTAGAIDGQWPQYDARSLVNAENYRSRWAEAPEDDPQGQSLQGMVERYLDLSDSEENVQAIDSFTYQEGGESQSYEVSFLDMLQLASMDYHQARMLGLGALDLEVPVPGERYQYLMEYVSLGDLGDGQGRREVTHSYMSLPTGREDQRLPLAVDLKAPVKGVVSGTGSEQATLTDKEGYAEGVRARYLSLYTVPLPEYDDTRFFETNKVYNLADFTIPVQVGLRYREVTEAHWRLPELVHDLDYLASVPEGQTAHAVAVPLNIPEPQEALYVHQVLSEGTHEYGSYGVNWFGRASDSTVTWSITTDFPPLNQLLPPGNLNPLLIREESPLLLSSAEEQLRLSEIQENDRTLIRLTFDFHAGHELRRYKVTADKLGDYASALDPQAIVPDTNEAFAQEIEVFFREAPPHQVVGKVKSIEDDPANPVLSIVKTEPYLLRSQGLGEIVAPVLAADQAANFVGGVITIEDTQYIIHAAQAQQAGENGPTFTVYKKEVTEALGSPGNQMPILGADLELPTTSSDGRFLALENMQSVNSWGGESTDRFVVQLSSHWPIHREVITQEGPDDGPEEILEKSRGIWDTAQINSVNEVVDYQPDGTPVEAFRGLYQITLDTEVLGPHPQFRALNASIPSNHSVDWQGGIVRVHTQNQPQGVRKQLTVLRTLGGADGLPLTLYAVDNAYRNATETDSIRDIQTGPAVSVNFYP
ncbi:MAG: hypothetical protein AAFQ98_19935, partial [Bacteroidota bacterium]